MNDCVNCQLNNCVNCQLAFANGLEKYLTICVSTLDNFDPRKKKHSEENNMSFMNQDFGERPNEKG